MARLSMIGWTVFTWAMVCAGGALLFLKLAADAALLVSLRLSDLERAARRVAAQQPNDDQSTETLQAA
jgi:uncharacterized membrane protein